MVTASVRLLTGNCPAQRAEHKAQQWRRAATLAHSTTCSRSLRPTPKLWLALLDLRTRAPLGCWKSSNPGIRFTTTTRRQKTLSAALHLVNRSSHTCRRRDHSRRACRSQRLRSKKSTLLRPTANSIVGRRTLGNARTPLHRRAQAARAAATSRRPPIRLSTRAYPLSPFCVRDCAFSVRQSHASFALCARLSPPPRTLPIGLVNVGNTVCVCSMHVLPFFHLGLLH